MPIDAPTDLRSSHPGLPAAQQGDRTFSFEEQIESLAQAIHEGDWMMVASEWRWCEASRQQKFTGYQRAQAILNAYAAGTRETEAFAAVIGNIDWPVGAGSDGRLRAKAEKVVQWFTFRERGYLL